VRLAAKRSKCAHTISTAFNSCTWDTTMKTAYILIQIFSALFALAAAVLWHQASKDPAADNVMKGIQQLGAPDAFGSHETQLVAAVIKQSGLNAKAAICAAVAAVLQSVGVILTLIIT